MFKIYRNNFLELSGKTGLFAREYTTGFITEDLFALELFNREGLHLECTQSNANKDKLRYSLNFYT